MAAAIGDNANFSRQENRLGEGFWASRSILRQHGVFWRSRPGNTATSFFMKRSDEKLSTPRPNIFVLPNGREIPIHNVMGRRISPTGGFLWRREFLKVTSEYRIDAKGKTVGTPAGGLPAHRLIVAALGIPVQRRFQRKDNRGMNFLRHAVQYFPNYFGVVPNRIKTDYDPHSEMI